MSATEAKQLKAGDPVTAKNGPYYQLATVVDVQRDEFGRSFYWITYTWTNPRGQICSHKRKHGSLWKGHINS